MVSSTKNGSIIPAAIILGASSLVSRIVGLAREIVLTKTFGAGDVFDAFVAAFRIPDLIFNLIVIGALSAAFIPLFTAKLVKKNGGTKTAFEFSLAVLNVMIVAVAILSLIYVLAADYLVPLITPGFSGEKLEMTILLSRIMALQPILLSISFVFSGILNSYKRFLAYALAPIVYNFGIIFGVIVLVPYLGIAGLGWGVVLGALLHMAIQFPSVLKVGWRWRPSFAWSSADVTKMWNMTLPRVFGLAAQQVNLMIVTIIGSGLVTGSIAVFHLANNVQYLPIGIFGLAFAQAAFPTLAEQVAREKWKAFRDTLTRSFRYILFFVIPISVFFYLLRAQIIRVLYGYGQFDWSDTILTYQTFSFLIISIFAQATVPLLTKAFYVREDTKTPFFISLLSIVLNLVLSIWLAPIYGIQGLALAFSASAILNLMLLLWTLHMQLKGFNDKEVLVSLLKITLASFLAGAVVQALKYPVAHFADMTRIWGVFIQLVIALMGGGISYLLFCWAFKCEELVAIKRFIPQKLVLKSGLITSRFVDYWGK